MPILVGKEVSNTGLGLMLNCWNGADFYGTPSANSLHLLKRYFTKFPEDADKVVVSIKSGIVDMKTFTMDGSPEAVRKFKIDIFGIGRVDLKVPVTDTVKALADLVSEGVIGGIQLSEVGADTIRRAASVAKIEMVEAEVSLWATEVFHNGVAETCSGLGIPIVAHTPLGAGMLTGNLKSPDDLPPNDYHRFFPRFQAANFHKNLELVDELNKSAAEKGCTTAQLALNWIKVQSRRPGVPPLIPVFGARSPDRVAENTKFVDLTEEDCKKIDSILSSFPIAGARYPAQGMNLVEY
ncbi:putative aldo/keto reductase [Whalleya microplaca]|nr:putative aldo/keto reductase [Whalleya microplaca]